MSTPGGGGQRVDRARLGARRNHHELRIGERIQQRPQNDPSAGDGEKERQHADGQPRPAMNPDEGASER